MFDRLDDTIVAISSPVGIGARGIIRLSGPQAFDLAGQVFKSQGGVPLVEMAGHRRVAGRVKIEPASSIPAEAYVFHAPASYTRQDIVELHLIGSPPVLAMLLEQFTNCGAQMAEPGEFTARAFFSGAMDLTCVEGVAAVIHARNDSQLRASEALLHGKLSRRSHELRDQLADLLALIEAEIDFVEEPIDFVSGEQIRTTVSRMADELGTMLHNAPSVERLEVLPEVMLVGRPNAGKSTLLNSLTGMDRAIRSATAGTTRDVLSAPLTVPGGEVMLLDSAGLLGSDEGCEPVSAPAVLAEEMSLRSLASADLILLVIDVTDAPEKALSALQSKLHDRPVCLVLNKIDVLPSAQLKNVITSIKNRHKLIAVSALTGEGVEHLRTEISHLLFFETQTRGAEVLALSNRQRNALREARKALLRAGKICDQSTTTTEYIELLALEVREAMNALSLLVGEVVTEELLHKIFSSFCIGK